MKVQVEMVECEPGLDRAATVERGLLMHIHGRHDGVSAWGDFPCSMDRTHGGAVGGWYDLIEYTPENIPLTWVPMK